MTAGMLGPYVLERELGAGAMGVVYLAYHPQLQARYALKVLKPELCQPEDLQRFQRELESMAAIRHPNAVRIHSSGVEMRRLYYAMDLIEGSELQDHVERGPMEPQVAARIVRDIAGAVAALHRAGYIHRDIKPQNILISAEGVPFLTDFGLARLFVDQKNQLTTTGELVGTPAYMAPEQALGETQLTPAVDVYALGVVLYLLLSGAQPFAGRSKMEVLSKVATGQATPLSSSAPGAPQRLAEIVGRCMRLSADERPTAEELELALRAYLGEAVGAAEEVTTGDVARRRRLTQGLVALCAVSVLLAGVAVVVAGRKRDLVAAEEASQRADALIARGPEGGAGSEELLALRRSVEGGAPGPERSRRLAELRELEGHAAVRGGRLAEARAHLAALEALQAEQVGRAAKVAVRYRSAGLAAAVMLAEGAVGEDASAVAGVLGRPPEGLEPRLDLTLLRVRLLCALGRAAEASELCQGFEGHDALRCRTFLAAQDYARATPLLEALSDPLERGRGELAVGRYLVDLAQTKKVSERDFSQRFHDPLLARACGLFLRAAERVPPKDELRVEVGQHLWGRIDSLQALALKSVERSDRVAARANAALVFDLGLLLRSYQSLNPSFGSRPGEEELSRRFEQHALPLVATTGERRDKSGKRRDMPALEDAEILVAYRPDNPQFLFAYAQMAVEVMNREPKAGQTLRDPERSLYWLRRNLAFAKKGGEDRVGHKAAVRALLRVLRELGRMEEAEQELWSTLKQFADDKEFCNELSCRVAQSYTAEGEFARALKVVARALEQDPSSVVLRKERIMNLHQERRLKGAAASADREQIVREAAEALELIDARSPAGWGPGASLLKLVLAPLELEGGSRERALAAYDRFLAKFAEVPAADRPGFPGLILSRMRLLVRHLRPEDRAAAFARLGAEVDVYVEQLALDRAYLETHGANSPGRDGGADKRLQAVRDAEGQVDTLRRAVQAQDSRALARCLDPERQELKR